MSPYTQQAHNYERKSAVKLRKARVNARINAKDANESEAICALVLIKT